MQVRAIEVLYARMLKAYTGAHPKAVPKRLVVYRDGGSEGEQATILSKEVEAFRRTHRNYQKNVLGLCVFNA